MKVKHRNLEKWWKWGDLQRMGALGWSRRSGTGRARPNLVGFCSSEALWDRSASVLGHGILRFHSNRCHRSLKVVVLVHGAWWCRGIVVRFSIFAAVSVFKNA